MKDEKLYLIHILECIERIEGYTISGEQAFVDSTLIQDAVIRNFEIIGEASNNIPAEIKSKYPNVPWAEMYLLRNKVSHEYFGIDYEIIWDVAFNHLPETKPLWIGNP